MIVTLTPNPSIDVTMELTAPLSTDTVNRAQSLRQAAGGKGINVSHVAYLSGQETLALYPSQHQDPFVSLIEQSGIPSRRVAVNAPVRINVTITDDRSTAKVNSPGTAVPADTSEILISALLEHVDAANIIVAAGSLPPGLPEDFYGRLVSEVRARNADVIIAVDTSDGPLRALGDDLSVAAPTIMKPNSHELGQLIGTNGRNLEELALAGHVGPIVEGAARLVDQGVHEVLVTLGPAGGVLVTDSGAWKITPPPARVRTTVGTGDASLAGYLIGRAAGRTCPDAARQAIAFGTATASLLGTAFPDSSVIDLERTEVVQLV
ncbi:hexose kinase, 1-phosphofructokinase family [Corynebacterium uterequi]|uniref:Hexose kinase, 1-phosphofructokinase family n=1 Tax=Corynebacterium uterequi TaxID=1072256 RepID=A0A0G3HJJ5_9CORY|nr:hexose kinase, 1-phosphofructokinase family [Corynebacterium uterequi]